MTHLIEHFSGNWGFASFLTVKKYVMLYSNQLCMEIDKHLPHLQLQLTFNYSLSLHHYYTSQQPLIYLLPIARLMTQD